MKFSAVKLKLVFSPSRRRIRKRLEAEQTEREASTLEWSFAATWWLTASIAMRMQGVHRGGRHLCTAAHISCSLSTQHFPF